MKIAVLVKEVPDTYGDRLLNLETGLADRAASEAVLDEIGERALEVALAFADGHDGTEVTILSMSPEGAVTNIRKGLAMGAHHAVHIVDDALTGADIVLTAEVLAAALRRGAYDLVLGGNASTDGSGGMMVAAIAELLGLPRLTGLKEITITEDSISGARDVEGGVQQVSADLPAVVSITEALPDARFPNFKGIMAAKKKPLETLTLEDLDVVIDVTSESRSIMISVAEKPARAAGTKITDEGDAGERLADFLLENRLV